MRKKLNKLGENCEKQNGYILIEVCVAFIAIAMTLTLTSSLISYYTTTTQKIKAQTLKNLQESLP